MPDVTALAIANSKLYGIEGNKLHHSGIRLPNVWADGEDSGYIILETPNGEELSAITESALSSAGNAPANKNAVKLTSEEAAWAKASGMTPADYARFKNMK